MWIPTQLVAMTGSQASSPQDKWGFLPALPRTPGTHPESSSIPTSHVPPWVRFCTVFFCQDYIGSEESSQTLWQRGIEISTGKARPDIQGERGRPMCRKSHSWDWTCTNGSKMGCPQSPWFLIIFPKKIAMLEANPSFLGQAICDFILWLMASFAIGDSLSASTTHFPTRDPIGCIDRTLDQPRNDYSNWMQLAWTLELPQIDWYLATISLLLLY